jgi:hypothetical protein
MSIRVETPASSMRAEPFTSSARGCRSGEIEAIQIHHLGPGRDEVAYGLHSRCAWDEPPYPDIGVYLRDSFHE